jgi:hypothetical protein
VPENLTNIAFFRRKGMLISGSASGGIIVPINTPTEEEIHGSVAQLFDRVLIGYPAKLLTAPASGFIKEEL